MVVLNKLVVILFASLFFFSSTAFSATPKTLVFSAIPDQDESRLKERFSAISDYLSKKLDIPVKYVPVKSYAAVVTAFRNNQVQLAWFGGLSGVQARLKVEGSQAIAQGIEDTTFRTYIIANHTTGLKTSDAFPKEIAGKTFTFGSKGSTSGRLMPQFYIEEAMKDKVNKVFKRVGFSGNHSKTISLVQTGAYEIGAVNFKVWDKELKEGKIDLKKVSIIWTTPTYPDYQWTIRGDVNKTWGKGFTAKVKAALLDLKDADLLSRFPRSGFIEAKNADYKPILDTAKSIGLID
ncbi:MAG: putative selenate ABC transporter substrate-binding protein [Gammaproteobacteria bacterium]|nr:putative selenate ABC transporter substrate-binding protein [Gammaproteobacteria bacterium]